MKAPIINQSEGCGGKEMGFGERGRKAEKVKPYTSLLGWVGHSSQNRRYRTLLCPAPRQLTTSGLCCKSAC